MSKDSSDSWQLERNRRDRRKVLTFVRAGKDVSRSPLELSKKTELFWKVLGASKAYWLQHICSYLSEDLSEYAGSRTSSIMKMPSYGMPGHGELYQAASQGDMIRLKAALRAGTCNIDAGDSNGWTALHWAAANGHLEVVTFLVNAGASLLKEKNGGGAALSFACTCGHLDIVTFLVSAGASVNAQGREFHNTALHSAAYWGHLDVMTFLVNAGASVNAEKRDGETPLASSLWNPNLTREAKEAATDFLQSRGGHLGRRAHLK